MAMHRLPTCCASAWLSVDAASAELRDWARRELDGYGDGAVELPAYRMVRAAVCIDGADLAKMVRGQQLSRWQIPEFARETITDEAPIPYGVAELEKLAASSDTLHLPGMPDLSHVHELASPVRDELSVDVLGGRADKHPRDPRHHPARPGSARRRDEGCRRRRPAECRGRQPGR